MICVRPTLALCLLLNLILKPGLVSEIEISMPKIPTCGSYFTPGMSMCSVIQMKDYQNYQMMSPEFDYPLLQIVS